MSKLSEYAYQFSQELIASQPAENRDDCKLMVVNRKNGTIEHKIFKDIINYYGNHDRFVFNDTKVWPARLYGNKEKTGAQIEILILRELNKEQKLWDVLVEPARKIRIGNKLFFGEDDILGAEVIDNTTSRGRTLRFLFDGTYEQFRETLFRLGEMPVPRFVRKQVVEQDAEWFNTIFAAHEGAVVSPAAGLHFSKCLMKRMEINDIDSSFITLHAGLGNYQPIQVEDLSKHKIDSEKFNVTDATAEQINATKRAGHKIVAVGTTVMRTLETVVMSQGMVRSFDGWTDKFIYAPYHFTVADALITNFQLPETSGLVMVSAFGGFDLIKKAYQEAIDNGYKFGTYGDAMLIL